MAKKNPSKASKEKRQKKEGPERSLAEEGEEKKIRKSEKKKDKKVYDLPGQKHDTPDERDPLRIFFETLYRQLPDNELAATWMMEWGLLPPDEARMVYEKLQKSLQEKLESPDEAAALEKMSTCSAKKKRKMTPEAMLKTKKRKRMDGNHGDSISRKKKNKKLKVSIYPTDLQPGSLYSPPDCLCTGAGKYLSSGERFFKVMRKSKTAQVHTGHRQ